MKYTSALAVVLLVTAATTPALAAPNDPPLAAAGLDQTVTRGSTVHLDAGGSRDPDGTITDYAWTVEAPDGATRTPNCLDCERARFQATSVGEYAVTLTVTDDDGATATDTLYVDVEPGAPPTVTLAGPSKLAPGERGTYTATASAGAAPLDRLVWYADGERHATTDANGTAASNDQPLQFPETGTHELRVVAVDEDDQRSNATRLVDVTTPGGVDSTEPSDGESTSSSPAPAVQGPQIVTGDTVLDATYSLTSDTGADWFLDDRHVDVGETATLTLTPGTHELYASPDSGGVSTFPDGTRTVLADPAPDVHLQRATEESVVTVDAFATDDLGNLQSLEVLVDGEVRRTTTLGGIERRSAGGDRLTAVERLTDVSPGNRNVTVRATDSRGQTAVESRTIHVPGPPEIMNARFVNDEPLTSKHPKLDPEDYTGQFEIDVELNGVDAEHVEAQFRGEEGRLVSMSPSSNRTETAGYGLTIRRNYSRVLKGTIAAKGFINWKRGNRRTPVGDFSGETHTELSKPVIRLDLVDAQNDIAGRGATFNASESFDPDGTELDYYWNDANSTQTWRGPVNQLDPQKLIQLNITDQHNQYNKTTKMLNWFTPGLQTPVAQNVGPVFPQGEVTYQVRTNHYELSKAVYEKEKYGKLIDFELVSDVGRVSDHKRYAKDENSGDFDQGLPENHNEAYIFHEWSVTVPASEFLRGDRPTVRIQSTRQNRSFRVAELPDPGLYDQVGSSTKLRKFDIEYVEEHPEYEVERTTKQERKQALERMGFDLYTARMSGTQYQLEKRVKTEAAVWETTTRDFTTKFRRKMFLNGVSDWTAGGSSEQRRERTVVDRVWRDSKSGAGEFTGDTRRVVVDPAETETLRQYEYERTYEVEVTDREEREKCLPGLGCWTYFVETTEVETRTTEYDYWSSRPRNPLHDWTGDTRIRTVEDAEYERQYEFRVEKTETYWEHVYHATTQEKVQPAQYEWKSHKTVNSEVAASIMTTGSDIRVGSTDRTREWTLRRQDGTYTRTTDTPQQRSQVVETEMTATADIEAKFLPPDPGLRSDIVIKNRTIDVVHTVDQFLPTEEAKNTIKEKANKTHVENH